MNAHATLFEAIKSRGDDRAAINTADWYVRKAIEECGEGLFSKTFGTSSDQLLSKAARQLVFSHPDCTTYKQSTSAAEFKELLPKDAEIPKHTALLDFHTLTTPQEDRDKDVLKTEGAEVDPELPILWQHLQTVPIGKMVAIIEHSKKALKMVSALLDINEFTADVIKLVEAKVLRWSHGFRALEWEERKANDPSKGFKVTIFEIMEGSKVSVPSNTEARTELFTMLGRGKLASDYWKTVAKHYGDHRPAQMAVSESTQMMLKLGDYEVKVNAQTPDDAIKMFNAVTEEPVKSEQDNILGEKAAVVDDETKDVHVGTVIAYTEPAEVKEESAAATEKAMAGTTGEANGHSHSVTLDDGGNGKTGNADGHSHAVEEFKVQEEDGHTHPLAKGDLEERQADVEEKSEQAAGEETAVEESDKSLEIEEKGGRVISARHLATLKAVHSDLEEMAKMDKMPRAGQAICESCITKLGGVIKAADKPTEDDDGKPKPDEEKPKAGDSVFKKYEMVEGYPKISPEEKPTVIKGAPIVWKPDVKEAAEILLRSDDDELLKRVRDTIARLFATTKQNEKAREYRDSSACQELIES